MVKTVNGDRGSSVVPIGNDEWMFMGRGRHVVKDGEELRLTSEISSAESARLLEILNATSGSKEQIRNTSNAMKAMMLDPLGEDDYLLRVGGPAIE